jgi:hypothetical protein
MVRGPRGSFKAPGMGQAGHENKPALYLDVSDLMFEEK